MDILQGMRTVVAIVDSGSFTGAAERLSLSRTMASKHVADLEAHLGVRLINRTTRRHSLTDAGTQLISTFRQVLDLVEETQRSALHHAAAPAGLLRISAPMSFGFLHVAPLIAPYLERHPAASLVLSLNDRFVELIEEGYDLAIRIGALTDSSLIATRIAESRVFVAASPAYLAAHGTPQHLVDIATHRCLDYSQGGIRRGWLFEPDGEAIRTPVLPSPVLCNNGDALAQMAVDGGGLVYLPDFIIADHVRAGRLAVVMSDIATRTFGIYAVYPAGRHMPLKTRAFVDHLRDAFTGTPPWALKPEYLGSPDTGPRPGAAPPRTNDEPSPGAKPTDAQFVGGGPSRAPRKASRSP